MSEMAIFAKVVETGSFSEAAHRLGTTPSATSRAVARLEKALGTRLLHRTTRKLRLSDSGQHVFSLCEDMLNAAQAVMGVSGQFNHEPQGMIRVSVPKAVGRFVIHPHIPAFLERYPKIDVQLLLSDRDVDLIDEAVDLAIRITDSPSPGLMGRKLIDVRHMLCATPAYLATHGIPRHPHDLKAHNCIYLSEDPRDSKWTFQRAHKRVIVNVHGRYAVNHTGARLDAVIQNLGIGSLPYFTARHSMKQGTIVQVLAGWEFRTNYCGQAWLLYPPTRHLEPKVRAFIHFMVERLNNPSDLPQSTQVLLHSGASYELPEAAG